MERGTRPQDEFEGCFGGTRIVQRVPLVQQKIKQYSTFLGPFFDGFFDRSEGRVYC